MSASASSSSSQAQAQAETHVAASSCQCNSVGNGNGNGNGTGTGTGTSTCTCTTCTCSCSSCQSDSLCTCGSQSESESKSEASLKVNVVPSPSPALSPSPSPSASDESNGNSKFSSTSKAADEISALFTPVNAGALHLRNRIIMGPLTRNRGVIPDEMNAEYYAQRATDSGLIISEGILIEAQGSEWSFAPGLFNRAQINGWKKVTDAVHKKGGLIVGQLWHLGRLNHPKLQSGLPIYGPSAIAANVGKKFRQLEGTPGYQLPQAIEDPQYYVSLFKQSAENAKLAGFDGVELQGAGGYLVHQFLDPTSNIRSDEWGGSIENRSRFALCIIDALISVWGADRVGIRLQPAGGFNDMGFDKADSIASYGYLLQQLALRKIAFVEMERYMPFLDPLGRGTKDFNTVKELLPFWRSGNSHSNSESESETETHHHGIWIANGGYDAIEGGRTITNGIADAISYSRPYIANPDLPYKFQHNLPINEVNWETVYGQHGGPRHEGYLDYPTANDK